MAKPTVVFVLGPPGAGKGTQSTNIVQNFGFEHLSAGDLLRAERATGSDVADLINTYIKEGKIVPVEITVGLLDKAMQKSSKQKFLVDGFPRNQNNLEGWEKVMSDKVDVRFMLFLDCNEQVCTERILERGKSSGRDDDNIDSIRKRHQTYESETKPILEIFQSRGMSRKIDAAKPVEEVWREVEALFKAEGLA